MHRSPWPLTATREGGVLRLGGVAATDLAGEFGTPLWIADETDLRTRCRSYRDAFGGATVVYASKAWCTVGVLQLVAEEGLWVDVASGGELHTAQVAGVPPERIVLHGNNKSDDELAHGLDAGVARIVVDSLGELERLEAAAADPDRSRRVPVWLRITPGIDAHTHAYVHTGQDDSKFGFSLSLGLADAALERARELEHVEVVGVHAHVGSQIFATGPLAAAGEALVGLLARWRDDYGVELNEVNVGGGMGVAYTHEDAPAPTRDYAEAILGAVERSCREHGLDRPRVFVEPGRAIVARSTVTLYTVGVVKRVPGIRTYVSVDGGMSDNIRPALYDAEHEMAVANRGDDGSGHESFTVVGKHCESGDLLAERARLPSDLRRGDLLAVAATGAYTEAMASNYNRLPRPAAVLVRDGRARLLIRRETYEDLVARDVPMR